MEVLNQTVMSALLVMSGTHEIMPTA